MTIQYNQNLDEKLLKTIKSMENNDDIDIPVLKVMLYYQDIGLIEGLEEIFDYCYNQLSERGYKCSKKGSKGDIYFGNLLGEKGNISPSFIEKTKTIIICFEKDDLLKGGNFIYFINRERYKNQIWKNTHILLNENMLYNLEKLQGYGIFGYMVFSFPIV